MLFLESMILLIMIIHRYQLVSDPVMMAFGSALG
jgi:hypothetical protein